MSRVKAVFNFINAPCRFMICNSSRKCFLPLLKIPQSRACSTEISLPSNKQPSILEPGATEDLSDYGPVLMPSYNLAAYADKSSLLQEFIKLGVELYKFDGNPEIGEFLLTLNFERNVKPYLLFLHENGVKPENFGSIITKFPLLFKEDFDDLQTRVNYLKSKKFSEEMIAHIITVKPNWLSFPVKTIDKRLGILQQTFNLSGDEVRKIVTSVPALGIKPIRYLNETIFSLKEELQLDSRTLKKMIVSTPSLLKKSPTEFVPTYLYLIRVMKVREYLIVEQPAVLLCRRFILKQRHEFLMSLGRAQYVPTLPGYVPLLDLVKTTDEEFCERIAKTSVELFYEFIKTY